MLKCKGLIDYTNLFYPNKYEKNDKITLLTKQLMIVEVFSFYHARSSIFIAFKIEKTGRSFPFSIATTSFFNAKDL